MGVVKWGYLRVGSVSGEELDSRDWGSEGMKGNGAWGGKIILWVRVVKGRGGRKGGGKVEVELREADGEELRDEGMR